MTHLSSLRIVVLIRYKQQFFQKPKKQEIKSFVHRFLVSADFSNEVLLKETVIRFDLELI